ncbi:MAG: hypothetical protein QG626_570 [Patescibacteria group bacterium]|jgi:hypothetical protein|nr:hypothetical protein [Patescibacteria group bacterium]
MGKLMVRISDDNGRPQTFVIIQRGLMENWVDYVIAILSPEDPGTNPNDYIAVGYDGSPDHDENYFFLPKEVSSRLVKKFLVYGAMFPGIAEA